MSKEQSQPSEPFAFTEHEKLWERLSHDRLKALLNDEQTTIHKATVDSNSYGEFLFITVSRMEVGRQQVWTLFGMGYHEYRERWYTQEWAWYQANPFPETLEQQLTRDTQTGRGRLFEMLAELTDDDGAIAELEDLDPDLLDSLLGDDDL